MKPSTASVEMTEFIGGVKKEQQNGRWRLVVGAEGVGHGVVAFAGLDLFAGLAGDVEGAEGAVDLGVGGGVAGEVLGAELVLDLRRRPPPTFCRCCQR